MIFRSPWESGSMKGINACLMMLAVAATAFADGNHADAGSDRERSPRNRSSFVPPAIKEIYEYYEVCGCTEKDLQCDLKQKGCSISNGKKYDAVTRWKITWDYDHNRESSACHADSFRVNVEVTFRYPKWVRNGDARPELVEKWGAYLNNLILHENRHRDIVVEAAQALSRAVAELPPVRTCAELDRSVQALSRSRMAKLIEDQNAYDAVTNHGRAEGALFP